MFGKGEGWGDLVYTSVHRRTYPTDLWDAPPIAQTAGEGSMNLTKHALIFASFVNEFPF